MYKGENFKVNKVLKTLFCATMVLGLGACSPKQNQASVNQEKTEETNKTTEENTNSIIGKWKVSHVTANGKDYSLDELKNIFSESQYKQILMGFTFTDKTVDMTLDGNDVGTTGYHLADDGSYKDETGKLTFKMENGELQLVQANSVVHFERVTE